MRQLSISVEVRITPTDAPVSKGEASPEQLGPGHFELILPDSSHRNIDALEEAMLTANFPALRDAIRCHLAAESKKKRTRCETL